MIAATLGLVRLAVLALLMALAWIAPGSSGAVSEPALNPSVSVRAIKPHCLPKLRFIRELQREDWVFGVTWSSDSTRLAAYSEYGNLVTVWNENGTIVQKFHRLGVGDVPSTLAFVAGDTEIVTPPASNTARHVAFVVFDVKTGALVRELPGPHPEWRGLRSNWAHVLVSSPDQSLLAVAFGPSSQPVILYSTKDWSKIAEVPIPAPSGPSALAFSADGRYLAIGLNLDVVIYDVADGRVLRRIHAFSLEAGECCISGVSFSPYASLIAVATAAEPSGFCRRLPAGGTRCKRTTPKTPIRVFRVKNGAVVASYPSPLWQVWNARWSRDGRFIAFPARSTLHLWNPWHPQERQDTEIGAEATSPAFAPNGKWLAACDGRTVKIFGIAE